MEENVFTLGYFLLLESGGDLPAAHMKLQNCFCNSEAT